MPISRRIEIKIDFKTDQEATRKAIADFESQLRSALKRLSDITKPLDKEIGQGLSGALQALSNSMKKVSNEVVKVINIFKSLQGSKKSIEFKGFSESGESFTFKIQELVKNLDKLDSILNRNASRFLDIQKVVQTAGKSVNETLSKYSVQFVEKFQQAAQYIDLIRTALTSREIAEGTIKGISKEEFEAFTNLKPLIGDIKSVESKIVSTLGKAFEQAKEKAGEVVDEVKKIPEEINVEKQGKELNELAQKQKEYADKEKQAQAERQQSIQQARIEEEKSLGVLEKEKVLLKNMVRIINELSKAIAIQSQTFYTDIQKKTTQTPKAKKTIADNVGLREFKKEAQDSLNDFKSSLNELSTTEGISQLKENLNSIAVRIEQINKEVKRLKVSFTEAEKASFLGVLKEQIKEVENEIRQLYAQLDVSIYKETEQKADKTRKRIRKKETEEIDPEKQLQSLGSYIHEKIGVAAEGSAKLKEQALQALEAENELAKTLNGLIKILSEKAGLSKKAGKAQSEQGEAAKKAAEKEKSFSDSIKEVSDSLELLVTESMKIKFRGPADEAVTLVNALRQLKSLKLKAEELVPKAPNAEKINDIINKIIKQEQFVRDRLRIFSQTTTETFIAQFSTIEGTIHSVINAMTSGFPEAKDQVAKIRVELKSLIDELNIILSISKESELLSGMQSGFTQLKEKAEGFLNILKSLDSINPIIAGIDTGLNKIKNNFYKIAGSGKVPAIEAIQNFRREIAKYSESLKGIEILRFPKDAVETIEKIINITQNRLNQLDQEIGKTEKLVQVYSQYKEKFDDLYTSIKSISDKPTDIIDDEDLGKLKSGAEELKKLEASIVNVKKEGDLGPVGDAFTKLMLSVSNASKKTDQLVNTLETAKIKEKESILRTEAENKQRLRLQEKIKQSLSQINELYKEGQLETLPGVISETIAQIDKLNTGVSRGKELFLDDKKELIKINNEIDLLSRSLEHVTTSLENLRNRIAAISGQEIIDKSELNAIDKVFSELKKQILSLSSSKLWKVTPNLKDTFDEIDKLKMELAELKRITSEKPSVAVEKQIQYFNQLIAKIAQFQQHFEKLASSDSVETLEELSRALHSYAGELDEIEIELDQTILKEKDYATQLDETKNKTTQLIQAVEERLKTLVQSSPKIQLANLIKEFQALQAQSPIPLSAKKLKSIPDSADVEKLKSYREEMLRLIQEIEQYKSILSSDEEKQFAQDLEHLRDEIQKEIETVKTYEFALQELKQLHEKLIQMPAFKIPEIKSMDAEKGAEALKNLIQELGSARPRLEQLKNTLSEAPHSKAYLDYVTSLNNENEKLLAVLTRLYYKMTQAPKRGGGGPRQKETTGAKAVIELPYTIEGYDTEQIQELAREAANVERAIERIRPEEILGVKEVDINRLIRIKGLYDTIINRLAILKVYYKNAMKAGEEHVEIFYNELRRINFMLAELDKEPIEIDISLPGAFEKINDIRRLATTGLKEATKELEKHMFLPDEEYMKKASERAQKIYIQTLDTIKQQGYELIRGLSPADAWNKMIMALKEASQLTSAPITHIKEFNRLITQSSQERLAILNQELKASNYRLSVLRDIIREENRLAQIKRLSALAARFENLEAKEAEGDINVFKEKSKLIRDYHKALKDLQPLTEESITAQRRFSRVLQNFFSDITAIIQVQMRWYFTQQLLFRTTQWLMDSINVMKDIEVQVARVGSALETYEDKSTKVAKVHNILIREMQKTGKSAEELGTILWELISAGFSYEEAIAGISSVVKLAIAAELDLAETTRIVSGLIRVFGDDLQYAGNTAEKFAYITDRLSAVLNLSQVDIKSLMSGLTYLINETDAAGLSFNTMLGILSVLNNRMLLGSKAGRSASRVLTELASNADRIANLFDIAIDPSKPLDLLEILEQLNRTLKDSSINGKITAQTFSKLQEVFGQVGKRAAVGLIQNIDELKETILRLESEEFIGLTEKMAETRLAPLADQMKIFANNILTMIGTILEPYIGIFRSMIIYNNKLIISMRDMSATLRNLASSFMSIFGVTLSFYGISKLLRGEASKGANVFQFLVNVLKIVTTVVSTLIRRIRGLITIVITMGFRLITLKKIVEALNLAKIFGSKTGWGIAITLVLSALMFIKKQFFSTHDEMMKKNAEFIEKLEQDYVSLSEKTEGFKNRLISLTEEMRSSVKYSEKWTFAKERLSLISPKLANAIANENISLEEQNQLIDEEVKKLEKRIGLKEKETRLRQEYQTKLQNLITLYKQAIGLTKKEESWYERLFPFFKSEKTVQITTIIEQQKELEKALLDAAEKGVDVNRIMEESFRVYTKLPKKLETIAESRKSDNIEIQKQIDLLKDLRTEILLTAQSTKETAYQKEYFWPGLKYTDAAEAYERQINIVKELLRKTVRAEDLMPPYLISIVEKELIDKINQQLEKLQETQQKKGVTPVNEFMKLLDKIDDEVNKRSFVIASHMWSALAKVPKDASDETMKTLISMMKAIGEKGKESIRTFFIETLKELGTPEKAIDQTIKAFDKLFEAIGKGNKEEIPDLVKNFRNLIPDAIQQALETVVTFTQKTENLLDVIEKLYKLRPTAKLPFEEAKSAEIFLQRLIERGYITQINKTKYQNMTLAEQIELYAKIKKIMSEIKPGEGIEKSAAKINEVLSQGGTMYEKASTVLAQDAERGARTISQLLQKIQATIIPNLRDFVDISSEEYRRHLELLEMIGQQQLKAVEYAKQSKELNEKDRENLDKLSNKYSSMVLEQRKLLNELVKAKSYYEVIGDTKKFEEFKKTIKDTFAETSRYMQSVTAETKQKIGENVEAAEDYKKRALSIFKDKITVRFNIEGLDEKDLEDMFNILSEQSENFDDLMGNLSKSIEERYRDVGKKLENADAQITQIIADSARIISKVSKDASGNIQALINLLEQFQMIRAADLANEAAAYEQNQRILENRISQLKNLISFYAELGLGDKAIEASKTMFEAMKNNYAYMNNYLIDLKRRLIDLRTFYHSILNVVDKGTRNVLASSIAQINAALEQIDIFEKDKRQEVIQEVVSSFKEIIQQYLKGKREELKNLVEDLKLISIGDPLKAVDLYEQVVTYRQKLLESLKSEGDVEKELMNTFEAITRMLGVSLPEDVKESIKKQLQRQLMDILKETDITIKIIPDFELQQVQKARKELKEIISSTKPVPMEYLNQLVRATDITPQLKERASNFMAEFGKRIDAAEKKLRDLIDQLNQITSKPKEDWLPEDIQKIDLLNRDIELLAGFIEKAKTNMEELRDLLGKTSVKAEIFVGAVSAFADYMKKGTSAAEIMYEVISSIINELQKAISYTLVEGIFGNPEEIEQAKRTYESKLNDINEIRRKIEEIEIGGIAPEQQEEYRRLIQDLKNANKELKDLKDNLNETRSVTHRVASAFKDMGKAIIKVLMDIIAKLIVVAMLESLAGMIGGKFKLVLDKITGFEKGGIIKGAFVPIDNSKENIIEVSKLFKTSLLQTGGIIHKPTLGLIGEGKNSEAVVPLPDNRSIPVTFTGKGPTKQQDIKIINIMDPKILPSLIMQHPEAVVNVITEDIVKRGPIYQLMRNIKA